MKFCNGTMKNKFKIAALSAAVALAAGCSNPDDPDGGTTLSATSVSGIAIDGYLARATVYADLNNDGRLNSGEPSAVTDGEGYFTTASDGTTDYCASDATAHHCLEILGTLPEEVVLRTSGGFDVFTGEPFVGELAATVEPNVDGTIPNQNINPLTTVLAESGDSNTAAVLASLGVGSDAINSDFLSVAEFDPAVANKAFLLHKVAVIFADLFEDEYDYFGEESGFPDGASAFIYEAFAAQLSTSSNINEAMVTAVFDAVDSKIVTTYNSNNDDDSISSELSGTQARLDAIANAVDILGLVNTAVPSTGLTQDQIRARMIGVEMVVSQMTDDDAIESAVDAALTEALDTSSGLYTALQDALTGGADIDFSALLDVDYSTPNYDSVSVSGGVDFSTISDKQLFVEIEEDDGTTGAALLLFDGETSTSTSGDMKFCVRYDDGDDSVNEDYETEGALFDVGDWSLIDERRVVISVLGGFDFILSSRGESDEGRNIFSMSFSGETETWDTDSDLEDLDTTTAAMDTNEACRAALIALSAS